MNPTGITFLDHTADVGIDVDAPSLDALFHRAATGMLALLRGEEEADPAEAAGAANAAARNTGPAAPRPLELAADTPSALMAAWLRELLFLHEVEHRDYHRFEGVVERPRVRGAVWTRPGGYAVREIKGVTYHALRVEEEDGRWRARIIFDV